MGIRWTEQDYRNYLQKRKNTIKKQRRKPRIKKIKPSKVEEIENGLKITIFQIHPSLNRWTTWHYTKRYEVKKEWEDEICILLKKYRKLRLEQAEVIITYNTPDYKSDKENFAPKFILDGLVKSGVLVDDNRNVVKPIWDFAPANLENQRTEIVIKWSVRDE